VGLRHREAPSLSWSIPLAKNVKAGGNTKAKLFGGKFHGAKDQKKVSTWLFLLDTPCTWN
jgi:hypothetical protein